MRKTGSWRLSRLLGSSGFALATGLGWGGAAQAQNAFQGTPTLQSGSVVFGGTSGQDVITVASDQAVIDWAPTDTGIGGGDINFLPAGNTGLFKNDATLANNFTVLNRVLPVDPTRRVALNGTIQARFEDMVSGTLTPGGNVWFYAPGGILVGSTAVIDVGGLTLTTADPVRDGAGNFINAGQTVYQPSAGNRDVSIAPGASITATPENSYVAMIAPVIRQGGNVNVNGSTALIAGEAATVTFNSGLFDIQVTQGTDGDPLAGGTAIFHNGTTAGPASSGAGDAHRVYMVAVPKNTAITLSIVGGGPLGFDIAGAADVVGNAIILSAGHNVGGDSIALAPANGIAANLVVDSVNATSALTARASNNLNLNSFSGNGSFAGDVTLSAGVAPRIDAQNGFSLAFARNLQMNANNIASSADGSDRLAGNAVFQVSAGSAASVGGDLTITANATGGDNNSGTGRGGNATGGLAALYNFGGTLTVGGNLLMSAVAIGGNGTGGSDGGNALSGQVFASSQDGGTATFNGAAGIAQYSEASGGAGANGGSATATSSTLLTLNGGTLSVAGQTLQTASAQGGAATTGAGGDASNGFTSLSAQTGDVTIGGDVTQRALVTGGASSLGAGGAANQGAMISNTVGADGATLQIGGTVSIDASHSGGSGVSGGSATATNIGINTNNNGTVRILGAGAVSLFANAAGGAGTTGNGGSATAGAAQIFPGVGPTLGGGQAILSGGATITAIAIGGNSQSGNGGAATGGRTKIQATPGATATLAGPLTLDGSAFGGTTVDGVGGDAIAGASFLFTNGGTISLASDATILSVGNGGHAIGSGIAGSGTGTQATISASIAGDTIQISGNVIANANGVGGDATSAAASGATGIGGGAGAFGPAGALTVNGTFFASARGVGGSAANGGAGVGGSASLSVTDAGTISILGTTTLDAAGIGKDALNGAGGTGTGGFATLNTSNAASTISLSNNLSLLSNATGGNGTTGGNATGGTSRISAAAGTIGVAGSSTIDATSQAGDGNTASISQGGSAIVQANGPGTITLHDTLLLASAFGGGNSSGAGTTGNATGGAGQIVATDDGVIAINGDGLIFAHGSAATGSAGTDGGDGLGGIAFYSQRRNGAITVTGDALVDTSGFGGGNMGGGDGIGGTGTGGDSRIAVNDLTITVGGNATTVANGTGGAGGTAGIAASGGAGVGGLANLGSAIGTLSVGGLGSVSANGIGGSAVSNGSGGSGMGGFGLIGTVTPTAVIDIANGATADGSGIGGAAIGAGNTGGSGTGRVGQMFATGGTVQVRGGVVTLTSNGSGGTASGGATGGAATGGLAEALAQIGTVRTTGNISLAAAAFGGQVSSGGGASGTATGGLARINSFQAGSTIDIGGSAVATASATGGNLTGGSAGLATGGTAAVSAAGGQVSIAGGAQVIARGQGSTNVGGNGGAATGGIAAISMPSTGGTSVAIGGNAVADARSIGGTAQGTNVTGGTATGGTARIFAQGGTLTIGGGADLRSSAIGGSAVGSGNGGDALSGPSTLSARNASITIGGTVATGIPTLPNVGAFVFAGATGGQGAGSGNGGNAVGSSQPAPNTEGGAQIIAFNDAAGPSSITAASALLVAGGGGGAGGSGGANGGRGGSGTGGMTLTLGSAGNGALNFGATFITAQGTGGAGGAGTVRGGDGGNGTGGFNQVGTQSGVATPTNAGSATFGNVNSQSAGIGGAGGSGGATGIGGDGGDGIGGADVLLVRGSPVSAASVSMNASGNGGTGGTGTTAGAGGDGTAGSVNVVISNRFQGTARGLLTVSGIVNGISFPTGGTGSTQGQRLYGPGNSIDIQNGDANVGSISLGTAGTIAGAGNAPSVLRIVGGSLNSANNISFTTESEASVLVDTGSITAGGSVTLGAGNFVRDGVVTQPAAIGTISGANMFISGQGDAIIAANLTTPGFLSIFVPGLIEVEDLSSGNAIDLEAGGAITTGNLTASSDIELDAGGSIAAGNITSGDSVTLVSAGNIAVGSVSAGLVNPSSDPDAGYNIGLVASGNVQFASAAAAANIGLGSDTGTVTGGAVNAGDSVLALARGNISLTSIAAGTDADDYLYFADSSMFALGGTIDDFDPAPIFAATPVRSGGSFSVSGDVTGGNILGATGAGIGFGGNVTASQVLAVDTGGGASFDGQVNAPQINIASSDIALGTGGRLGTSGTSLLTLNASGAVVFGGTAGTTGYQIDASEASRITGQNIVVDGGSNDIEIRDASLTGSASVSGNLAGPNGSLNFGTTVSLRVTGAFSVTQMAPANAVSLQANRVMIATDAGSILLSGNSPGGILSISANDIHVATQSVLDRLATDVNFAGRDVILGIGTRQGTPTLQARSLSLSARNTLLIQNNGGTGQFAGFNAYAGGLSIVPAAGSDPTAPPLDMVVYGSLQDPATGMASNGIEVRDSLLQGLTLSQFATGSAINGCALAASSCATFSSDSPVAMIASDIVDRPDENETEEAKDRDEQEEVMADKAASSSPIQPPVTIIDTRPMVVQPVLDDPITGSGNPALSSGAAGGPSSEKNP